MEMTVVPGLGAELDECWERLPKQGKFFKERAGKSWLSSL